MGDKKIKIHVQISREYQNIEKRKGDKSGSKQKLHENVSSNIVSKTKIKLFLGFWFKRWQPWIQSVTATEMIAIAADGHHCTRQNNEDNMWKKRERDEVVLS